MTSKHHVQHEHERTFARLAIIRAACGLAACIFFCASCATSDDLRVGIGGRGSGLIWVEDWRRRDEDGAHSGVLIDGTRYDLRGRAVDVSVSVGVPAVQAIAGYEWSRKGSERFQARLFGVRALLSEPERCSGPYVIVLGRAVDGSSARTAYFDGFDLGLGFLGPLHGPLFGDVSMSWAYVDGDAIGPGRDSISELRFAIGLRFEF